VQEKQVNTHLAGTQYVYGFFDGGVDPPNP